MFKAVFLIIAILISTVILAMGHPDYDELDTASSDDHQGRVQIKVYRGPTEQDGRDRFAPWGYWVKQPADADHH